MDKEEIREIMPLPRYKDKETNIPFNVCLFCQACRWAIALDKLTEKWTSCRRCGAKLITKRIDYPSRGDEDR